MGFKVRTLKVFERQAKRLMAKYPSLKNELGQLGEQLQEDPAMGASLGRNCYKIRLAIASKGKGNSGGARIIANIHEKIVQHFRSCYI